LDVATDTTRRVWLGIVLRIAAAIALLWILAWQLDAWQRLPKFWPHLASLEILLAIGLTVPDPDLRYNAETEHWEFGAIDWSEFWNVVNGHGPCNKERLAERVQAWDDGAWVREAALAHARKQATAKEAA
jgi:hypothetical protein